MGERANTTLPTRINIAVAKLTKARKRRDTAQATELLRLINKLKNARVEDYAKIPCMGFRPIRITRPTPSLDCEIAIAEFLAIKQAAKAHARAEKRRELARQEADK